MRWADVFRPGFRCAFEASTLIIAFVFYSFFSLAAASLRARGPARFPIVGRVDLIGWEGAERLFSRFLDSFSSSLFFPA